MGYNTTILNETQTEVQPSTVVPSATWQMLSSQVRTEPLPQNFDAIWDAARGMTSRLKYRTRRYMERAQRVLDCEHLYKDLSEAHLREAAMDFRALFRTGRETPEDLIKGFALIREVAARERSERHYLVQVAGGLARMGAWRKWRRGKGRR
jgi:hypothetical protein